MTAPYFDDGTVQLYLGDCREVLPALGVTADLVIADPPYAETSLAWDRWPDGWPTLAAMATSSLWCFGSLRMFLDQREEFAGWKLSQDIVWRKQNGSGFAADRFRRVHEHVLHWYRGSWQQIHKEPPRITSGVREKGRIIKQGRERAYHLNGIDAGSWTDDGTRITPSVIEIRNMWRAGGIHPTEKPLGILTPLIQYGCPPGGLVIDPFAGSGSTLDAARHAGRRAIGVEAHEPYAEAAAKRLAQAPMELL